VLVVVAAVEIGIGGIAWRATSLKAMFCAESLGAAATTTELRMRFG